MPGPVGGRWTVTRHPDGWILAGDPDPPAVTEVAIDADALWWLATRGITPRDAEQRAQIRGDRRLVAAALTVVSIIR